MKAGIVFASIFSFAVSSFAVTSQFRGVNWADKRDNFVSDVLVLSGLSQSYDYVSPARGHRSRTASAPSAPGG